MLRTTSRLPLAGLALLAAGLIVIASDAATSLAIGEPVISDGAFGSIDAPDVAVLRLFFAGLPLFLLAIRNVRRRTPWLLAIALTSAFWCYFVWQVWQDSLTGFAGGANIGLGLIMMASPFVTIVCLAAWRAWDRAGRKNVAQYTEGPYPVSSDE